MNDCEPFLTFSVRNDIFQHMIEVAPQECCGWITLSKSGEYKYVKRVNVHPEPELHFRMSKADGARVVTDDSIVAYVHSHPNGPTIASKGDMETQMRIKKPCVIAARDPNTGVVIVFSIGDHMLDYPLDGREFHYTRFDCLEYIRSEAWQREGRLMDAIPRIDNWWNEHEVADLDPSDRDMYLRLYASQGYQEYRPVLDNPYDEFHPRLGDVVLMQLGAPVINHAAVYLGNNLIGHHRIGKRSGTTPIGYCLGQGQIRKWVRHDGSKPYMGNSEKMELLSDE